VDPLIHPAALPGFERIYLGHEVVGTVVEVGEGVKTLRVGDRVLMRSRFLGPTCFSQEVDPPCRHCEEGNYALCENQSLGKGPKGVGGGFGDQYIAHESEVWKVPDEIPDETAILIEPLACSVRGVVRSLPQDGEKVLVIGCGTIGLGVIQALRALAPFVEIYAVARYPQQIRLVEQYGAIPIKGGDLFTTTEKITGGKKYIGPFRNTTLLGGFDRVYDCVGNSFTLGVAVRLTRAGGTVMVLGVYLHRMKVDLTPIWHQEVDIRGSLAHGVEYLRGEKISTFDLTARLFLQKKFQSDGFITHRFPLSEWRRALKTASDKRTGSVKVAIICE
jgi:threonine dehydrogenase-like Zn-dependent dehydrogenase